MGLNKPASLNNPFEVTVIILAGGKSSRFGTDKSMLRIDNELLIERSIRQWGDLFTEIVIVSDTGEKFPLLNITEVKDIFPHRGPLGGIHAGLHSAHNSWCFVVACDMPSIDRQLITDLIAAVSHNVKVILPHHNGRIEPLCALYHRDCLSVCEELLLAGSDCILDIYEIVPTLYLKTHNCFFNINYPEDVGNIGNKSENESRIYKHRLNIFCTKKGLDDR